MLNGNDELRFQLCLFTHQFWPLLDQAVYGISHNFITAIEGLIVCYQKNAFRQITGRPICGMFFKVPPHEAKQSIDPWTEDA